MESKVYFVAADGSENPESLARKARAAYLKIGLQEELERDDFVALKIHFGEKNNKGFINPAWLRGVISEVRIKTPRAFLTDSNTLYVGQRSNSVDHIRLAWSHGFTPDVVDLPVIIADGLIGRDKHETKGAHGRIAAAKISSAFLNSDAILCLTHVTGHVQTGIGAALKNLGMGCASRAGKLDQHSVVHPRVKKKACRNCGLCLDYCPAQAITPAEGHVVIDDRKCIGCGECIVVCKYGAIKLTWDEDYKRIQEKVAEYALYVHRIFKGKSGYLNFLTKITKDCDCMAKDDPRIVDDIGILASRDPVAIDKATADLVIKRSGGKDPFRAGYDIDWGDQLRHAVKIGLGSMDYDLIEISS